MDASPGSPFSLRPLSVRGCSVVESFTASDSADQSLLGLPVSHSDRWPIPSIEKIAPDGLQNGLLALRRNKYELRPIANARCRSAPDDAESNIRFSEAEECPFDGQEVAPDIESTDTPREKPIVVEIPQSTLTQPRSLFEGFIPPATEVREPVAIAALLDAAKQQQSAEGEHVEFDLEDFSIYINTNVYPYELRPLQHLTLRLSSDHFYFDGVVSYGRQRFYLRRIPFRQLPIGNYGSDEHTVGDQIWIRSELNESSGAEIYYKLKSPSREYVRFYEPFLWIADLAKHIIDYCDYLKEKDRRAVLYDFKSDFSIWLLRKHLKFAGFERWHSANRGTDFRAAVIANIEYIWKEAHGLDAKITSWHRVWEEVKTLTRYKPNLTSGSLLLDDDSEEVDRKHSKSRKEDQAPVTIATPYAYDLFSHMVFGNVLKQVKPSATVEKKRSTFVHSNRPIQQSFPRAVTRDSRDRTAFITSIKVRDVISTKPDDEGTDTEWKQEKSKHYEGEHLWFGLVQKVHRSPKGNFSFDVIWLYQPVDTPCGVMKYPWNNELFLSNNCTCHHDTAKVQAGEILSTHSVDWFGDPSTTAEFFVRQTYLSDDCRWTTLQKEHLTCGEEKLNEERCYTAGDAVLVETKPKTLQLEAFIVEAFFGEQRKRYVRLRKLSRRRDVDKGAPNSPPNELVYTDQLVEISAGRISRHCLVRAFRLEEKIATPYDCNGTGDVFFMTHQEVETEDSKFVYVPLDMTCLHKLRQGFDPSRTHQSQKLQGLDLFCGGGNFGRGLEDGGAIEMRWANDIWSEAIHTYMANCKPEACTPLLGSVDDLLHRALRGDHSKVPRPGDVHFISAGSPCPGFSLLTPDKTTDRQRKNQSLVASFVSFVDLYRPYYGLLENVPQMVNTRKYRDACVFSQTVCALVGLGYQVQVMFLDAWSFGTPQSRSRVFLCFSAPGFRMPKIPASSHSHPPGTVLTKLGEMSCGRPFDRRKLVSTPFKYVSAKEAIGDLPDIQDAKADYCVGFPDHRLSFGYTPPMRKQIWHIPTQPWEMSFSKAWYGRPGIPAALGERERHLYPPEPSWRTARPSRGWTRVHPYSLFSTVATKCLPTDSRVGTTNHWYQHRPSTIMEARRAQGFRDHELLVGSPTNQWHIIGNSVARQVSLALGLAIREAWFGTRFDERPIPQTGLAAFAGDAASNVTTFPPPNCVVITESIEGNKENNTAVGADTSGPDEPPEGPFSVPTPNKSISPTPATSVSNEASDSENSRKRPLALYVEIFSKRARLSAEPDRGREASPAEVGHQEERRHSCS
ncbi:hypothetical protein AAE478_010053 [Parahypoxylon ruwenzoriense]